MNTKTQTEDQTRLQNHVNEIAEALSNPTEADWFKEYQEYNEGEEPSAYDYLNDVLDIEYIVNREREYIGARILVTFGGPNIWINTRTNTVEGYWWGDKAEARYTDTLDIDEACGEIYGS